MNIFKILYHDLKKYRMISMLIVLNIIISAFVICFSYGIYQNYNIKIDEGESEERVLSINPTEQLSDTESSITTKMVINFVKAISQETLDNIKVFSCNSIQPTSAIELNLFDFEFIYINNKFRDYGDFAVFTDEEYNSYKRIVAVNPHIRDDIPGIGIGINIGDYDAVSIGDSNTIEINGEDYEIIDTPINFGVLNAPITAFNDDTPISKGIDITFKTDISRSQYDDIAGAVYLTMGDNAEVSEMEISPVTELFYYRTILFVSALISILAALNFAALYRFILQKRIKTLTIFRICGCTRFKIILIYLSECLIAGLPLFALTLFTFDKLALPALSGVFEYIGFAYSPLLYLAIFGIYAISSFVVLLIMISIYILRRSIVQLKAGGK